jgi:hypothetical protein
MNAREVAALPIAVGVFDVIDDIEVAELEIP